MLKYLGVQGILNKERGQDICVQHHKIQSSSLILGSRVAMLSRGSIGGWMNPWWSLSRGHGHLWSGVPSWKMIETSYFRSNRRLRLFGPHCSVSRPPWSYFCTLSQIQHAAVLRSNVIQCGLLELPHKYSEVQLRCLFWSSGPVTYERYRPTHYLTPALNITYYAGLKFLCGGRPGFARRTKT